MTKPLWLIAEREFNAYTATASFWIALAVGPLAMALVLMVVAMTTPPSKPTIVEVRADDAALAAHAAQAISEAGRLDGRKYELSTFGTRAGMLKPTARTVLVSQATPGETEVWFGWDFPLSAAGRRLVARTLERDLAHERLAQADATAQAPRVLELATVPPPRKGDPETVSRFALVMMLWLTLTGSLGMLLQAVVRERTNRALESLLAASSPHDIVYGKLVGVGAVSLLVLAAWLGATGLLAPLAPEGGGYASLLIRGLAHPLMLARAGAIYIVTFAFYGLFTVAVGARARDTAAAQNLSRPMFGVLLAVFFACLTATGGGAAGELIARLVYVPPFTPFILLLCPPGTFSPLEESLALALFGATMFVAARIAVAGVTLTPQASQKRPSRQARAPA